MTTVLDTDKATHTAIAMHRKAVLTPSLSKCAHWETRKTGYELTTQVPFQDNSQIKYVCELCLPTTGKVYIYS